MKYILLLYENEENYARMTEADFEQMMGDYAEYSEGVKNRGRFVSGEPLETSDKAKSVQLNGGKLITHDGPFAETKEQLGGFYIIECENLDQAIDEAAKIPAAKTGTVEIRPIMEY